MLPGTFINREALELATLTWPGTGTPLYLVHATGFCGALWDPIAGAVAARTAPRAMDVRGHGRSSKPDRDYPWQLFADDLLDWIRSEEDGPIFAMGHSSGATAVALAAAQEPERFERILLIDPTILPPRAEVVVAEIYPSVVEWNRESLEPVHRRALEDKRVLIRNANVWDQLDESQAFDAILLDVDNGPSAWCLSSNGRLYDREGLKKIRAALTPGGVLAVWSAYADAAFVKRLGKSGFKAKVERVRDHQRKGAQHTIFLARKSSGRA